MKKILLLADGNSSHTKKWVKGLLERGYQVGLFSLSPIKENSYIKQPEFSILYHAHVPEKKFQPGIFNKLIYLKSYSKLLNIIAEFKPNILHAHYATSYGFLAALTKFHPFILSVWGSDVYDFPKKSFVHKLFLKFNLSKSDRIFSTSHVMAKELEKYTSKEVAITPFGINLDIFKPIKVTTLFEEGDIVIGTIKSLEKNYAIDNLLLSFKELKKRHSHLPLKLLIVGSGSCSDDLKELAARLNILPGTIFTGKVSQDIVPQYHNMLSIYVSLSVKESFGVAAIEASACEKPVVVSDADGFKEVVENGVTGIIVPRNNIEETVKALEYLLLNQDVAIQYGKNGRKRVQELYDWNNNLNHAVSLYNEVLS